MQQLYGQMHVWLGFCEATISSRNLSFATWHNLQPASVIGGLGACCGTSSPLSLNSFSKPGSTKPFVSTSITPNKELLAPEIIGNPLVTKAQNSARNCHALHVMKTTIVVSRGTEL